MNYKNSRIAQDARDRAKIWHDSVNQKYSNDLPYHYHTDLAGAIAKKYISLIPEQSQGVVLAAVYLHDTLEDCRKTYNDLKKLYGEEIADLVYAVTNDKGKTRKERASAKYYEGINAVKYAVFVKLSDRIANVLHGVMHGGMLDMYKNEHENFIDHLDIVGYEDMVHDLEALFETRTFNFTPIDKQYSTR